MVAIWDEGRCQQVLEWHSKEGHSYVGEFSDGLFHGKGKFQWAGEEEKSFEGTFEADCPMEGVLRQRGEDAVFVRFPGRVAIMDNPFPTMEQPLRESLGDWAFNLAKSQNSNGPDSDQNGISGQRNSHNGPRWARAISNDLSEAPGANVTFTLPQGRKVSQGAKAEEGEGIQRTQRAQPRTDDDSMRQLPVQYETLQLSLHERAPPPQPVQVRQQTLSRLPEPRAASDGLPAHGDVSVLANGHTKAIAAGDEFEEHWAKRSYVGPANTAVLCECHRAPIDDLQGWHTVHDPSGDSYVGEWLGGMFHGHGTYFWSSGSSFQGMFRSDCPQAGVFVVPSGERWELHFDGATHINDDPRAVSVRRIREQQGGAPTHPTTAAVMASAAETVPVCHCHGIEMSLLEGSHQVTHKQGSHYSGEWRQGQMSGNGRWTHASLGTYAGSFAQGLFHGEGSFVFPDGDCFQGVFSRSCPTMGVITKASGASAEVHFDGTRSIFDPALAPTTIVPASISSQASSSSGSVSSPPRISAPRPGAR